MVRGREFFYIYIFFIDKIRQWKKSGGIGGIGGRGLGVYMMVKVR